MRAFPVLAALVLLATAMPVRADPGGGDAPDRWEDALDIAPGTYSGDAGPQDEDWYRIVPPAGQGVRVTVEGDPGYGNLWLVDDRGWGLESRPIRNDSDPSGPAKGVATASSGAGVRFGVRVTTEPFSYAMVVELVDVADVEVSDLRVTESAAVGVCFRFHEPCVEATPRLHLDVELRNRGNLPWAGTLRLWAGPGVLDQIKPVYEIETLSVSLPPGGLVRIGVTWDPVGVGEVDLVAHALRDANPSNNHAITRHAILLEGAPGVVLA